MDGNFKAERRVKMVKNILESIGISPERIEMHFISASMSTTFVQVIDDFVKKLKKLGPIRPKR